MSVICASQSRDTLRYLYDEVEPHRRKAVAPYGSLLTEEMTSVNPVVPSVPRSDNFPDTGGGSPGTAIVVGRGRRVGSFYDADGNGRPSLNELLDYAETNERGIAVYSFFADPAFVHVQNEVPGVHARSSSGAGFRGGGGSFGA